MERRRQFVSQVVITPPGASPPSDATVLLRLARHVIFLIASACFSFQPALASTVIVPDQAPTVQLAIDTGADTVLLREGTYPERPLVDRAVVLQGIGVGEHPRMNGLDIVNTNFWAQPPALRVSRISLSGRVNYMTVQYRPRLLTLTFSECSLESGLELVNQDAEDIWSLSILGCRLGGDTQGSVEEVTMVADTVDGSVAWRARRPYIADCWFRGGSGRAIELTGSPVGGPLVRNRIENYGTGIYAEYLMGYAFEENTVLRCGIGIQLWSVSEMAMTRNVIQHCGSGVYVLGAGGLTFCDNTILDATGSGAVLNAVWDAIGLDVERNVIGRCGGAGLEVDRPEAVVLRSNTVFANSGTGIVLTRSNPMYHIAIDGNIVADNGVWGLAALAGDNMSLGCNDWFGNDAGAVSGLAVGATDVSVDPMFCDGDRGDVSLNVASPLLEVDGCGRIGALGVGCGVTGTLVQRFTAERVREGVRVVWEVAQGASAVEIWVERAEGSSGVGWIRPVMDRRTEGRAVVEVDHGASSDRAFRYRLVAFEGGRVTVLDPGIVVGAQGSVDFELSNISPNPGDGPVVVGFGLKRGAAIVIEVYDVQGRRVTELARGVWPGGTHVVLWNGQTHDGKPAPPGLYVLRYAHPGGESRLAFVRLR